MIIESKVNKPVNPTDKRIDELQESTGKSVDEFKASLDKVAPVISGLTEGMEGVQTAIKRLEEIDNSLDITEITDPIHSHIEMLSSRITQVNNLVESIDINPKVEVNTPPVDLSEINNSFETLNKDINELFRDLDLMERPELKEYFKKILDLLEKINKKTWSIIGGAQNNFQAYLINTGRLVNVTAVESADTPGVYGILALNADGSAIGSGGGGVVETFKRITSAGDIRVTSGGDTRVYAT